MTKPWTPEPPEPESPVEVVAWGVGWAEDGEDCCLIGLDKDGAMVKKLGAYVDSRIAVAQAGTKSGLPSWTEYEKARLRRRPKVEPGQTWLCHKDASPLYPYVRVGFATKVLKVEGGMVTLAPSFRISKAILFQCMHHYDPQNPQLQLPQGKDASGLTPLEKSRKKDWTIKQLYIVERLTSSGWAVAQDTLTKNPVFANASLESCRQLYRESRFRLVTYVRGRVGKIKPPKIREG